MGSTKFPTCAELLKGTNPNKTLTQFLSGITTEGTSPSVSLGLETTHH